MNQQLILRMTFITTITLLITIDFNKTASAEEIDFTSDELKETAQQYLNIPYLWGGTTTSGFDCSGYVIKVFSDLGIDLPRTTSLLYEVGESVPKDQLQPGDLVFFNTLGNGVSHVGIYYGNGQFIHSQSNLGVSMTDLDDPKYWGARYIGAKRIATVGNVLQTVNGTTAES